MSSSSRKQVCVTKSGLFKHEIWTNLKFISPGGGKNGHWVKHGMEWSGMEWNGMVWNGMEWNGKEWIRLEWNGMEWNGILPFLLKPPPLNPTAPDSNP